MWREYYLPSTLDQAISLLADRAPRARLVAGATDLILELERGVRPGVETLIDVTRLPDLGRITEDEDGTIHLGPLVTHNDCAASRLIRAKAYPLARAAWEVGAPQIRTRATVAGNLITASPANDTITPLVALDAVLTLASPRGSRRVPLGQFYTGVRKTVLEPDEMLIDIAFAGLRADQRGTFVKVALRRAQAVSVVNAAVVVRLSEQTVHAASITLGSVAPTIIHASSAESFLAGRPLEDEVISEAAGLASGDARPIDDVRGSAPYRREMVRIAVLRSLRSLRAGRVDDGMPSSPVTLGRRPETAVAGRSRHLEASLPASMGLGPVTEIHTHINGRDLTVSTGLRKTLLRFLREDVGLTGTKEGCAEGECGACTVFLDGQAVMSCMVPAPRADGAQIVTIEGLSDGVSRGQSERPLHPLQRAFIETGAVQCGYCTPGFIMSGAKLLEERPHPTKNEIEQALTGNLCRCTGYYKIIQAIEQAAEQSEVIHG
jgi:carbon-monoxide dehydrogenase medium subunit